MCAGPSNRSLALAYHNAQLQASAFREEFDTEAFEDLTRPKYDMIHKVCQSLMYLTEDNGHTTQRAGALLREWKGVLTNDVNYNAVLATTGTKRKPVRRPAGIKSVLC